MGKLFLSGSNENVSSLKDGLVMKTSKEVSFYLWLSSDLWASRVTNLWEIIF